MIPANRILVSSAALVLALATTGLWFRGMPVTTAQQAVLAPAAAAREQAYRANNLGVTRLEQFDYPAAVSSFREALTLDPQLAIARLNLGIALYYAGAASDAERELTAARVQAPERPHADYVLGLIARASDRTADAIAAFSRVQTADPTDAASAVNLAQLHTQERRFPEAIALLRRVVAAEPFNATAVYSLATALLRSGDAATDEGREAMDQFQRLQDSTYAVTYSQTYLEQGRYAEAVASTGAESDLVDRGIPDVTFTAQPQAIRQTSAPAAGAAGAGSVTLFDLDGDGDLDLADAGALGLRLFQNDGGRFDEVTAAWLGATRVPARTVVAGDFDNDSRPDLAVLDSGGVRLLRRSGASALTDVTIASGLAASADAISAAWLDADHDGDLDLAVAYAPPATTARLYRNNGNGAFTDITTRANLPGGRPVVAVVPTDFDNRRDIDLVLVATTGASPMLRNMRDGSFRDVAAEVGLGEAARGAMVTLGDVNKDSAPDLFFARPDGPAHLAMSNGLGRFVSTPPPAGLDNARVAQFVDYDNDGLLDLVALTANGPRLARNLGREWADVSDRAFAGVTGATLAGVTSMGSGDLDGDGDTDLVLRGTSGPTVWRNDGGHRARSIGVRLRPLVSNRSSTGAKIDMRAGSLRQRIETYAATPAPAPADIRFGLGARPAADVIRILWPSGILQAEIGPTATGSPTAGPNATVTVEELNRKPSSCPYLFTWNGERFEFITDFLGGGEMGYWLGPGQRNTPDSDEYVRISGDALKPRNGRYELRITNELEEVLFLDRAELVAIAHPTEVEVHPNEGLGATPGPLALYSIATARPPLRAFDATGTDVLGRLRAVDRQYADGFALGPIRGYAQPHALTLVLPRPGPTGRRLLLMTGWTDYAFSNDNVAAHQAGLALMPPALEMRSVDGSWHPVKADIGVPVGRPQTVVVDLSAAVPAEVTEVRLRTSMRIYWDQVLVDTSDGRAPYTMTRLDAQSADLRWRGYSAEAAADGREPFVYDYGRVSPHAPWKLMTGRYTREGDVGELLTRIDDRFVVSRTGDEIALTFDATALPPLPTGWTRTFLLYADGFSKEMNLHSASPDEVAPLPFHGMTRYPYAAPEAYPTTSAHRDYLARYQTRVVARLLPSIDALVVPGDVTGPAPRGGRRIASPQPRPGP